MTIKNSEMMLTAPECQEVICSYIVPTLRLGLQPTLVHWLNMVSADITPTVFPSMYTAKLALLYKFLIKGSRVDGQTFGLGTDARNSADL